MITKSTTIDHHEIKRNLFGTVTIDGQKTLLRYGEAVKAVTQGQTTNGYQAEWSRQKQQWVTLC